jgi:acetyl-CoA C-acetyltransferase
MTLGCAVADRCRDRSMGQTRPAADAWLVPHYAASQSVSERIFMARRAAIVAPLRTPVGAFGGALRDVAVEHLGALVVNAVIARSGIDPAVIGDVCVAQSYANSETPCIGRWIALQAGLPVEVPGLQIDRRCGGGLQAIVTAAMMVETGVCDVVLAGGVESMSRIEYYTTAMRWGARAGTTALYDRLDRGRERSQPAERFGPISGMIETAENLAADYAISRADADAFAAASHRRAAAAWTEGRFAEEVVPVPVPQRKGDAVIFARDEGIRPDTTPETLARLRPLIDGGTVTAGNSSQQNDAAAACLVVAEDRLADLGLEPIAFLAGWSAVGCDPARMGIGPVPAVRRLLERTGVGLDAIELIEINEAFAVQVLAVLKALDMPDQGRLNVNGSGISLGHPIGATGVRIMTTLTHEMKRRGARYGLETMCIGGGQGMAALFERA